VTFARLFRTRLAPLDGRPNPVALITVALLVFLFFLLHASFVVQPGIRVELPAGPFEAGARYDALILTLSQEGMVFFNDSRTTLEGLPLAFRQAAHDRRDATLIVEADERVPYQRLVAVYNMASEAGIRRILLATRVAAPAGEPP
jgi:biopolymer transport protein ExbD